MRRVSIFARMIAAILLVSLTARAQQPPEKKSEVAAPSVRLYSQQAKYAPMNASPAIPGDLFFFNRIKNTAAPALPFDVAWAIGASSTLLSGTVFRSKDKIPGCWTFDWTTAVLAEESSNVLVYGPGDVSVFCSPAADPTMKPELALQLRQTLYIVLPVKAIWTEISGFHGDLNDPARKSPADVPTMMPVCYNDPQNNATPITPTGPPNLKPCDSDETLLRKWFYRSGWLYNRIAAPGVWAGSFSLAPVVVTKGSQSLSEDIRFYGSSMVGPGWLGFNAMFEKGASVPSNLNSLMGAVSYDFHLTKAPSWFSSQRGRAGMANAAATLPRANQGLVVRPGELILSSGQEYAPTRTKGANGVHEAKDLNLVEGLYYRQPIAFTALRFPSLLTLFPTVGAEGGWHIIRYQADESAQFFRKVVGLDASVRYPFRKAPNFTSTKPATIDYSLRERILSGEEPYTDTHPLDAMGNLLPVTPILSRQRRSYSRIALNWPLSSYVAVTATVQRGSLPPDFASVAWTFTVGLSLASTGISEH